MRRAKQEIELLNMILVSNWDLSSLTRDGESCRRIARDEQRFKK